jgi:signal transduction histidine kinase
VHVTARNNTSLSIGSAGTPDITPQTVAFMAVFDRTPVPPPAWKRAWMAWQRFISSWFPFLLGGAVGLLAFTLVLSPAAFVRERRLVARDRVREDMARMRRDAHDKVYNRLSALSKRVATSGDELAASNAAALTIIAEDIRSTVGELQEILGEELRHTDGALTSLPLAEQLRGVCAAQAARLAVEVSCEPGADLPEVDPLLGWDLQCVAEEAITNAVRHGGAAHIRLRASATDGALELTVTDDGCGSDVLRADDAPAGSTGLRGMRDRLEKRGGSLSLARGRDGGTAVSARVALPREGHEV